MPKRLAVEFSQKVEIVMWSLRVTSKQALVDTLYPAVSFDAAARERILGQLHSWAGGHSTANPDFLENYMRHIGMDPKRVWRMMDCSAGEFLERLPEPYRMDAMNVGPADRIRRLMAEQPDWVEGEGGDAHVARDTYERTIAGLELVEGVDHNPAETLDTPANAWLAFAWRLCVAIQTYLEQAIRRDAIVIVVGPAPTNTDVNFDRPVFLAATGSSGAPLDGAHAQQLALFFDKSTHKFPHARARNPPPGARFELNTGFILQAWKTLPGTGFENIGDPIELKGGVADHYQINTADISQNAATHSLYLEISTQVKVVHVFRLVGADPRERLVVAIDFLENGDLDDHQCSFILEAMRRAFERIAQIRESQT